MTWEDYHFTFEIWWLNGFQFGLALGLSKDYGQLWVGFLFGCFEISYWTMLDG